ncbi:MAG TPA: transporter, partial [Aquabacterium sp.]|nr:transporter [Aquabacterium sp.]
MTTAPTSRKFLGRTLLEWFSSLPVFALLLLTLIIGTGEMVHGQLLKLGESMFGDKADQVQYFMLRADPVKPDCNPNPDIEAQVQKEIANNSKGSSGGDDIDNLFGDSTQAVDPSVIRKSVEQARDICKMKMDLYERVLKHQTPQVKFYRTLETSFFGLFQIGTDNRPLILLLMVAIAAITTTLGFHHIGIRPGHYTKDYFVQSASQAVAAGLLLFSTIRYYQILQGSGVPIEHPLLHYVWMA